MAIPLIVLSAVLVACSDPLLPASASVSGRLMHRAETADGYILLVDSIVRLDGKTGVNDSARVMVARSVRVERQSGSGNKSSSIADAVDGSTLYIWTSDVEYRTLPVTWTARAILLAGR